MGKGGDGEYAYSCGPWVIVVLQEWYGWGHSNTVIQLHYSGMGKKKGGSDVGTVE